ncbi:hypothetical protein [Rummeliibacillus suwonensis]|uniref:hypothetical protein n=1 Tax=Rummeliibacillus suwonensis TaxID=1306154 RepID=UPI0011B3BC05|nr:hypothetical protein [Rummeliibacillus suwonensis]
MTNYKNPALPFSERLEVATIVSAKEGKTVDNDKIYSPTVLINFVSEKHMLYKQSFLTGIGYDYKINKLCNIAVGEDYDFFDLKELIGKRVGLKIKPKLWKGQIYQNVVDVYPAPKK